MIIKNIQNMPIRLRVILIIIATNVIIILFSVFAGTWFVQGNINSANETDLSLVAEIANYFISSEIDSLRLKAFNIAHSLMDTRETEWPEAAALQSQLYPEFIGMAIFDAGAVPDQARIFSTGLVSAPLEIMEDTFVQRAFGGYSETSPWETISFSSTYPSSEGMVFYLAAPLPAENWDRILVLTIPGMYFSDRFNRFVIWETGHIFMVDAEGNMIANMREFWVQGRINFFTEAERSREEYGDVAAVLERVVNGETGVGYFPMAGVPRLCSFRPVSASHEGWGMGIIAPLPESPFRNIDRGLIVVGLVALSLSVSASIFFSRLIRKPFEEKEVAETSSKYKSNFLAKMSHEIRTPMNAITGMAEILLRGDLKAEEQSQVEDIKRAGYNLLSIINEILDISKIEAGKLEIIPVNYLLSSLITDAYNSIKMKLLEKPIRFYANIDSNIASGLIGDEIRVRQILMNLLSNAVKYTEQGHIGLEITEVKREEDKIWLKISVSDTGNGIKDEDQASLFSEFSQLDMNRSTIEGTGLGLSITKQLCTAMDGEISFVSKYGKGSTFTVILPQGIHWSEPLARVENPDDKKILVYEGRDVNAQTMCWSLRNLNIPYLMVKDEESFADALQKENWYYIFSSHGLYNKILPIIKNTQINNKMIPLALIQEQDDKQDAIKERIVSLPVYTLSIANVINGKEDKIPSIDKYETYGQSSFIIPRVHILVVDDIATNLNVAKGLLSLYKPYVDICLSGAESIELVKKNSYDLVFMDHMMPGTNGIEAVAAIRSWEKEQGLAGDEQCNIIALTANAVTGMREMFIENGFNDFISKPIEVSELEGILVRWLPQDKLIRKTGNTSKQLIILIDEDPVYLRQGRNILSESYSVTTLPSVEKLDYLLAHNQPALILLSTDMPEISTNETIAFLKSKQELSGIPLVFTSLDAAMEGADCVIKPFDPIKLLTCVEENIALRFTTH